ncbi:hypothetical protein HK104_010310 [Borealophlyctis nickersoniae]|nr:hypothetical protein HK104_010310 [Borealophlyctis nickersoniae]
MAMTAGTSPNIPPQAQAEVQNYSEILQSYQAYWLFKKLVRDEILKSKYSLEDIASVATATFNSHGGFAQLIENHVALMHGANKGGSDSEGLAAKPIPKGCPQCRQEDEAWEATIGRDALLAIASVQKSLDSTVRRRLVRFSAEVKAPLARRRSPDEQAIILQSFECPQDADSDLFGTTIVPQNSGLPGKTGGDPDKICLYDDADLLEAVLAIPRNGRGVDDKSAQLFESYWASVPITFDTPCVEEMQFQYRELHPQFKHVGMDDCIGDDADAFLTARIKLGEKILASKSSFAARQYAKQGIPACLRPKMWDLMLQSIFTEDFAAYTRETCRALKTSIAQFDLIADRLLQMDVRQCQNDDTYFVFEDVIRDVMLLSDNGPGDEFLRYKEAWEGNTYPPNGVLPFWGVSCYAMPLCYLHADAEAAYMTFRELYARYFSHLHTLNSTRRGLLYLSCTFETLLKQTDALLYAHLAHNIGHSPLHHAFRWIMYGFIGVLDVEQVLLLWDRIIAFDKAELLAAVAVAIFLFRKGQLMGARNEKDIEHAFSDLAVLKVIPLLQYFIFVNTKVPCRHNDEIDRGVLAPV